MLNFKNFRRVYPLNFRGVYPLNFRGCASPSRNIKEFQTQQLRRFAIVENARWSPGTPKFPLVWWIRFLHLEDSRIWWTAIDDIYIYVYIYIQHTYLHEYKIRLWILYQQHLVTTFAKKTKISVVVGDSPIWTTDLVQSSICEITGWSKKELLKMVDGCRMRWSQI